jgi:hypothetical protein
MGQVSLDRMHQKNAQTYCCNNRDCNHEHTPILKRLTQMQYRFVAAQVIWFSQYLDLSVLS